MRVQERNNMHTKSDEYTKNQYGLVGGPMPFFPSAKWDLTRAGGHYFSIHQKALDPFARSALCFCGQPRPDATRARDWPYGLDLYMVCVLWVFLLLLFFFVGVLWLQSTVVVIKKTRRWTASWSLVQRSHLDFGISSKRMLLLSLKLWRFLKLSF